MNDQLEKESHELAMILSSVQDSLLRAQVLTKSDNIRNQAKDWIKSSIINRLSAIRKDILYILPNEDAQIIARDIMNDDAPFQMQELQMLFMKLTKEQRDEIEETMNEMIKL